MICAKPHLINIHHAPVTKRRSFHFYSMRSEVDNDWDGYWAWSGVVYPCGDNHHSEEEVGNEE